MIAGNKLGIFLITYNRAEELRRTLGFLLESPLKNHPITVLDNCSTDHSASVGKEFEGRLPNYRFVTNKINIGANANFLRAIELSDFEYTWVLCDDDFIDLTAFEDVLDTIEAGELNLIHVGAHAQKNWRFGGQTKPLQQLVNEGYCFFKFSSFMPCNIFRTAVFHQQYMVKAFNNIGNSYPHMPYAFGLYTANEELYISKKQVVTAGMGSHSYDPKSWLFWWMRTCELLEDKNAIRTAFLDQWKDLDQQADKVAVAKFFRDFYPLFKRNERVRRFVSDYFTASDKLFFANLRFRATVGLKTDIEKLSTLSS